MVRPGTESLSLSDKGVIDKSSGGVKTAHRRVDSRIVSSDRTGTGYVTAGRDNCGDEGGIVNGEGLCLCLSTHNVIVYNLQCIKDNILCNTYCIY